MHPSSSRRATTRVTAAGVAAAALVLGPVAAASAHVHVTPDTTAAGGYALLTFRVPNESPTASTTRLSVALPTGTPFVSVSVQPVPGWTATVDTRPLAEPVEVEGTTVTRAPSAVTWTASPGAAIAPGQFQQFAISAGALPRAGTTVLLPATQTYSDGTVVDWDEATRAGAAEPEHPAPALTTTAATSGDEAVPAVAATARSSSTPAGGDSSDTTGRWLGAVGTGLGALALVVSLVRGRRPARAGA